MVKHGLVFVWRSVPVTRDMPSIHETIESDESFSSLSDGEHEDRRNDEQQPSHSTTTNTPEVKKSKSHHHSQGDTKGHRKAASRSSSQDPSQAREPRALVEYSDVSSEAFSEPEAGEITDSPSHSPVVSPRANRQRLVSPSRSARLSPRPSPTAYSSNLSRSPSFVPREPLHSDGEVEASPTPSHHTPHTSRPLVPYPVIMSPDRHTLDSRGEYYRPRDPYHHSRTPSESDRDHSRARKKEHKKEKKRKGKKRSRSERSHSPLIHKKKKKKSKHKSRSGSPEYDGGGPGEGSVASSEEDLPEPVVIKRIIPSHDPRSVGAPSRMRSREDPSPLSSNEDIIVSPQTHIEANHTRVAELRRTPPPHSSHHRSRERTPHRSPPRSPPRHRSSRHPTPPPPQPPSASKTYDRPIRSHHISPRRPTTPPMSSTQRRGNVTSPGRSPPRRVGPHRAHSPPLRRSRSPAQYIEIKNSPDSPTHGNSRYYASTSSSRKEEKKKKKKERARDYHPRSRRSRSPSPSRSRSRSRGQSPR